MLKTASALFFCHKKVTHYSYFDFETEGVICFIGRFVKTDKTNLVIFYKEHLGMLILRGNA